MSRMHACTGFPRPGLHVWREGTDTAIDLQPVSPWSDSGWVEFRYDLEPSIVEDVLFMLFNYAEDGSPGEFERTEHQRRLPRNPDGSFAERVWFVQGARRVLSEDPLVRTRANLRVHLISRARYRPSQIFLWNPANQSERRIPLTGEDQTGPFFDLTLAGTERSFFLFKFIRRKEGTDAFTEFEPDQANRLWTAADGGRIWTHSEAAEISRVEPVKKLLRVHYRQEFQAPARMRFWQHNSEFQADADGTEESGGWTEFKALLYTHLSYGFQFWNPSLPEAKRWEHPAAVRDAKIVDDSELWTLEGDRTVFSTEPHRNRQIEVTIAARAPGSPLSGQIRAHVWVNHARGPLSGEPVVSGSGSVPILTYPSVVTSFKFRDSEGGWERVDRHTVCADDGTEATRFFVVLGRPPLLRTPPPANLFEDPPFLIRRPGAYEEDGEVRFVLHAPDAARVDLLGEWSGWASNPLPMRCTRDGTYWWASVPKSTIVSRTGGTTYHGARYGFLFNETEALQDPAAGWMESSWNQAPSRLVQSDRFVWHDTSWQRPGREYLAVYQLHASRFTNRFSHEPPLKRIAREIDSEASYLRDLGITAILLMPLNEVGTRNSWGYDPAFFYAVENDFGGPDALKELVDVCHQHGLAVLLDVVFNHAGSIDNILWSVARESFFDGDTAWGAMINFDHPQCIHFFAQNLVYLAQEYHLDGFRLDHTATIVHSHSWDPWSSFVRKLGSGGGWEFLHAIRNALHSQVDPRCLLMAEHLPNEWRLTNFGGPMDTQWNDEFHDRLVDACKGHFVMPALADALKLSHTASDDWYKVTNYPESHDEVGNVRDRICYVAGFGRGLRMSKVAAAASLLSRGIPMFFMGAESAEDLQFKLGDASPLDLDGYLANADRGRVRAWWRELLRLRRNPAIQGPAPLNVRFAEGQLLAFTRGDRADYYALLNFGGWSGHESLGRLNLPGGRYRELWNSTWPAFAIEGEDENEHANGGREARLDASHRLHIPDYGAVILERTD